VTILNGCSGETHGTAKSAPLQLRTNAASATYPNINVGKVRDADFEVDHAEGPQPALS